MVNSEASLSNVVDALTERWLEEASIGPGMRVLDIGCGPGAVSFMLARRVGESGFVCGVDHDARMLDTARAYAEEHGVSNIAFMEGGFDVSPLGLEPFDAAVGRRVLMYQADPVAAVRALAKAVKPGGLVFFHEHDMIDIRSGHVLPLHDRVRGWLRGMLEAEGANLHMGFDLHRVLSEADLRVEAVKAEANIVTTTVHYPVEGMLRAIMPRLVQHGIATPGEVGVETLDQRLIHERKKAGATCIWEMVFCAWARTVQNLR